MKTPTYLMQQNKLLSSNIGMQDKVFNLKNFVNSKCTETSRKLNAIANNHNSLDDSNTMGSKEYFGLIKGLVDDFIDHKITKEEKAQLLHERMTKPGENESRKRLVNYEVEKFKESDEFLRQIDDAVEHKLEERV